MHGGTWGALVTVGGALTTLLSACGGGSCGTGVAASDLCPGPTYGYAAVEGRVLRLDGTPAVDRQTFVSCGEVIGSYGEHTDRAGRFAVRPVYSNADTLFHPHPPRGPDGGFLVTCGISAEVRRDVVARDSVVVPFAPTRQSVTAVIVELREPAF